MCVIINTPEKYADVDFSTNNFKYFMDYRYVEVNSFKNILL